MKISKMTVDIRSGNIERLEEHADPTWEQAEAAISALDGEIQTTVSLEGADRVMMIAGGKDGRYMIYIADDDNIIYIIDPVDPETAYEGPIGGQWSEYPATYFTSFENTMRTAKAFFETRSAERNLTWGDDDGNPIAASDLPF